MPAAPDALRAGEPDGCVRDLQAGKGEVLEGEWEERTTPRSLSEREGTCMSGIA